MSDDDTPGCASYGCQVVIALIFVVSIASIAGLFLGMLHIISPRLSYVVGLFLGGAIGGLVVGSIVTDASARRRMKTVGVVALSVGGACLLGIYVLSLDLQEQDFQVQEEVPAMGGTVGPVTFDKGMFMETEVKQSIEGESGAYQRWSFVTVELLDKNKKYLSSFGSEFWNYAGIDDGYPWQEDDEQYELILWVPAGTYHLRLKTEANVPEEELGPIRFEMDAKGWLGYPYPMWWLAYVAFFLGGLFIVASYVSREKHEEVPKNWSSAYD